MNIAEKLEKLDETPAEKATLPACPGDIEYDSWFAPSAGELEYQSWFTAR